MGKGYYYSGLPSLLSMLQLAIGCCVYVPLMNIYVSEINAALVLRARILDGR